MFTDQAKKEIREKLAQMRENDISVKLIKSEEEKSGKIDSIGHSIYDKWSFAEDGAKRPRSYSYDKIKRVQLFTNGDGNKGEGIVTI